MVGSPPRPLPGRPPATQAAVRSPRARLEGLEGGRPVMTHIALLYALPAAALVAGTLTFRHRGDPPVSLREMIRTLGPFTVLGLLESLMLCYQGHMSAEWLLPMAA